jgi:hypothetical protein
MAISQEPYWKVICDVCGDRFPKGDYEGDFGGGMLFNSEKEAREQIYAYDGEIGTDDKVWCPGCIEKRDEEGKG